MNYLQFEFETENQQQLEQLIALLNEQGFEGFEEDEDERNLKAFISEDKFNEEGFYSVLDLFSEIIYTRTIVEHVNWNQKWEEDFKPVIIGDFVSIRAGFHAPVTGVAHEIIITPKMSFGTGHHATTFLMVQQMALLNFIGKSVLDFGTGTGLLAIIAEKCGANKILAIDYDEWSITNARENIEQNKCVNIELALLSKIPADKTFDIVLANINLNIIISNLISISNVLNPGAYVLLSGFLKENEILILGALKEVELIYESTFQKGDWIVIVAKKL